MYKNVRESKDEGMDCDQIFSSLEVEFNDFQQNDDAAEEILSCHPSHAYEKQNIIEKQKVTQLHSNIDNICSNLKKDEDDKIEIKPLPCD